MGSLPEPEAGPLEGQLLIWLQSVCQDRLQATDKYVAAMRAAAKAPAKATKKKTAAVSAPAVKCFRSGCANRAPLDGPETESPLA